MNLFFYETFLSSVSLLNLREKDEYRIEKHIVFLSEKKELKFLIFLDKFDKFKKKKKINNFYYSSGRGIPWLFQR